MDIEPASKGEAPFFSVCIVTFKRPALLAECLAKIAPGKQRGMRLVAATSEAQRGGGDSVRRFDGEPEDLTTDGCLLPTDDQLLPTDDGSVPRGNPFSVARLRRMKTAKEELLTTDFHSSPSSLTASPLPLWPLPTYEIVVSDDCPQGSARTVVESIPGARWVRGPGRGIAANRNHVAKSGRGDWLVYVDDDEWPEPNWLACLYEAAASGKWDVIEGQVDAVNYPDSIFWYAPELCGGGIFGAGNLAIRRDVLFRLGAFDERLATSHEDMDLGRRIVEAGVPTTFLTDALVLHPARRRTLRQVLVSTIQQQCQCYHLQHVKGKPSFVKWLDLPFWTARYLYRCHRIGMAVSRGSRSRSRLLLNCLRIACAPVAAVATIAGGRVGNK